MTGDTSQSDSRLTRRQKTILSLVAVVCILLAGATLVAAQGGSPSVYSEGWEEYDTGTDIPTLTNGDYTTTEDADVTTSIVNSTTYEGNRAARIDVDSGDEPGHYGYITANASTNTFAIEDSEFNVSHQFYGGDTYPTDFQSSQHYVDIYDSNGDRQLRYGFNHFNNDWVLCGPGSCTQVDRDSSSLAESTWTEFRVEVDNDNDEATLYVGGQERATHQLGSDISGEHYIQFRYGVNGVDQPEDGFAVIDGAGVSGEPVEVSLDVNNYQRPGTTQTYAVEYGGSDVTNDATVTSSDNDTLTVYPGNNTLVATENTSDLPAEVTVTAEYQGVEDSTNVTVAKPSVENLDLLPVWWKVNATVGDGMMLWLIVATLAAVVATRAATPFAGVGSYVMFMIAGWMTGSVSDGVMVATILTGLFLGMNLAANVDTTIRGSG